MNNLLNISLFFDRDFINIIYKDLEINKNKELKNFLLEAEKNRENRNEISIFKLNKFKIGSIGYSSKELEGKNENFEEIKIITSDYNGPNPDYDLIFIKILFNKENEKVLGFQIANSKNIEARLECIKKILDEEKTLQDLGMAKVYENSDKEEMDIINMAAIMGSQENKGIEDMKQVKAEEIEKIMKEDVYILDVRESYEYRAGHIKGAKNISLRNLVAEIENLPKDKNIYVYCRTGHRSLDATTFLISKGLKNVYNIKGGIIELSLDEFRKNKGNIEKSKVLTNYIFE